MSTTFLVISVMLPCQSTFVWNWYGTMSAAFLFVSDMVLCMSKPFCLKFIWYHVSSLSVCLCHGTMWAVLWLIHILFLFIGIWWAGEWTWQHFALQPDNRWRDGVGSFVSLYIYIYAAKSGVPVILEMQPSLLVSPEDIPELFL